MLSGARTSESPVGEKSTEKTLDASGKKGKIMVVKTILSSKGQIVIPLEIRRKLGLSAGAVISCDLEDGRIVLDPRGSAAPARLVSEADYLALEAPSGAPEMTPERVKEILTEL